MQQSSDKQASVPPIVMTIAGSDSGGGAGIQADLKTFAAFGVHGTSVITAVTAQNTREVRAVFTLPAPQIAAQFQAVVEDLPVTVIKIGMLGSAAAVRSVIDCLLGYRRARVVLDPVMIASSGRPLLDADGLRLLREELLPLADVLTPNLPEAQVLLGRTADPSGDPLALAAALRQLGCAAVLLKGAHRAGTAIVDHYVAADRQFSFSHPRLPLEGHGTGCTLAAALAAGLALGQAEEIAVRRAVDYVQAGLARAFHPGGGTAVLGNFRRD